MHPGSARRKRLRGAREPQDRRIHSGLPCAVVYHFFRALGEPSRLPASQAAILETSPPTWRQTWGRQDRMTSRSAKVAARQSAHLHPPHSAPRFVTIAICPLVSARDAYRISQLLQKRTVNFRRSINLNKLTKIRFSARAIPGRIRARRANRRREIEQTACRQAMWMRPDNYWLSNISLFHV
jgi:hypothetical protein